MPTMAAIGVRSSCPIAAKNCCWLARARSPRRMASTRDPRARAADIRDPSAALSSRRSATYSSGQVPGVSREMATLPNRIPSHRIERVTMARNPQAVSSRTSCAASGGISPVSRRTMASRRASCESHGSDRACSDPAVTTGQGRARRPGAKPRAEPGSLSQTVPVRGVFGVQLRQQVATRSTPGYDDSSRPTLLDGVGDGALAAEDVGGQGARPCGHGSGLGHLLQGVEVVCGTGLGHRRESRR